MAKRKFIRVQSDSSQLSQKQVRQLETAAAGHNEQVDSTNWSENRSTLRRK
jgi:hypothetical protein